jgi:tRNA1Val (adenine37-N6)-methyltransferase
MEAYNPGVRNKTVFYFQQFAVQHTHSSMKVGTDGVLLGAWTNVADAHRVLDIGTGTGLLALMLAQRTQGSVLIDAVEIQEPACRDAEVNFEQSQWRQRITLHHRAIQAHHPEQLYDLIISNPPYFQNSLKSPDENRNVSRHTDTLTFQELINHSQRLLTSAGRLSLILPATEAAAFTELGSQHGLHLLRRCVFRTLPDKPESRWLMEFSRNPGPLEETSLLLYAEPGVYAPAYVQLTRDFYLIKPDSLPKTENE